MNIDIQVERWRIEKLIPGRANNPRTHSREQVASDCGLDCGVWMDKSNFGRTPFGRGEDALKMKDVQRCEAGLDRSVISLVERGMQSPNIVILLRIAEVPVDRDEWRSVTL